MTDSYVTGNCLNRLPADPQQIHVPVWLNDLLAVAHSSVPVLHVETDAHGLIHHVQHVDVGVCKNSSHLLQAELTHLQEFTRGCLRVKEKGQTVERERSRLGNERRRSV